jgi:hypothetical protein
MGTSNAVGARLHDVLHRLPGMPAHAHATELNANATARRLHHRPLRNRPLRNRALQNWAPRNTPLGSPGGPHGRPPRLLPGWQAWLGRRLGPRPR